jgi:hypothetical protein
MSAKPYLESEEVIQINYPTKEGEDSFRRRKSS